jgi:hypothetical protein
MALPGLSIPGSSETASPRFSTISPRSRGYHSCLRGAFLPPAFCLPGSGTKRKMIKPRSRSRNMNQTEGASPILPAAM